MHGLIVRFARALMLAAALLPALAGAQRRRPFPGSNSTR